MSTRSGDQQKKQRQKEFRERKEHQELLKAEAKKAKRNSSIAEEEIDRKPHDQD
ncbi:hypothetical protein [Rufibacter ruber]|uniref:hypothetical protein n=1 Tax=Rufibacter ruber TaxID=1783499 RepID=UPI000AAF5EC8|nr:hypothetical protein [Rufibacter ruber]